MAKRHDKTTLLQFNSLFFLFLFVPRCPQQRDTRLPVSTAVVALTGFHARPVQTAATDNRLMRSSGAAGVFVAWCRRGALGCAEGSSRARGTGSESRRRARGGGVGASVSPTVGVFVFV